MPSQHQLAMLMQPPDPRSVENKDGFAYIAHQYVRVNLIRVFGFGNWSFTVDQHDLVDETKVARKNNGGENWRVTYRVRGTLTVTFDDGRQAQYTEYAVDSMLHPQYDQAHDNAIKAAASGALRRSAINLGSLFGLSLYFDGYRGEIVGKTNDTPEDGDEDQDHDERAA